jgi:deazaflavin-dependent oxidoreductase (nitroreductase family)
MTQALRVPRIVPVLNPILKRLLAAGAPLGFNGLVTIRGRTSGLPRTTALAVVEADGRRWLWSPWGDVQWVRNLRAAGEATVEVRRRSERVTATELSPDERLAFFRDTLTPLARDMRGGMAFIRYVDGVDLARPEEAAVDRPVFELHPAA